MRLRITIILILFLLKTNLQAQSGCGENLTKARQTFSEGHFYEVPAILQECVKTGLNKTQKIQAYLLLTRTYLFIDDPDNAESSYLSLLRLDPEFKVSPETDPIDLVYLSQKFKTTPIFKLYAKVGVNFSSAMAIQNFGVDNTSSSLEEYSPRGGFHFGAGGELNLTNNFSLGLEMNFLRKSYSYQNELFGGDMQEFIETQTLLESSIFVKYRQNYNKFEPFIYVGYSPGLLLGSNGELDLIDKTNTVFDDGNSTEVPVTGPSEDLDPLRVSANRSVFGGGGFNYKLGYNYLSFDLRYSRGLNNIVDPEGQYSNSTLLYKFGFVDDDKRLSSFMISVGYVYPLYKPRKIKKGNTKNFLKSIFNKKK